MPGHCGDHHVQRRWPCDPFPQPWHPPPGRLRASGRSRRHAGMRLCHEILPARRAETQGAKAGLIGHTEQIVALHQRPDSPAFPLRLPALGALHQASPPGVGRGVTQRAMDRLSGRRFGIRRVSVAGRCRARRNPHPGTTRRHTRNARSLFPAPGCSAHGRPSGFPRPVKPLGLKPKTDRRPMFSG